MDMFQNYMTVVVNLVTDRINTKFEIQRVVILYITANYQYGFVFKPFRKSVLQSIIPSVPENKSMFYFFTNHPSNGKPPTYSRRTYHRLLILLLFDCLQLKCQHLAQISFDSLTRHLSPKLNFGDSHQKLEHRPLPPLLTHKHKVNSNKYMIPIVFFNYVVTFWLFISYSRFQLFWGVAVGISSSSATASCPRR